MFQYLFIYVHTARDLKIYFFINTGYLPATSYWMFLFMFSCYLLYELTRRQLFVLYYLFYFIKLYVIGTGKTTMANVVATIMLKMKLVSTDKVVFVNNSLELIGSYVGQTPAKVDAKIEEAKGGVIFIDEAYSIVKESGATHSSSGSFGKI